MAMFLNNILFHGYVMCNRKASLNGNFAKAIAEVQNKFGQYVPC